MTQHYFPLCISSCLMLFDGYFYRCVSQLFHRLTLWMQQLYAFPPLNLSLVHIVLFLHILLLLCVWSLCDLVSSFFLFLFLPRSSLQFLSLSCCFCSLLLLSWTRTPFFPFIYLSLFPIRANLLFPHSLALSRTLFFFPFVCSLSPAVRLASCVSEPMVVCAVHPPASHSAPSFLRQYAGHLGRTALRRELGGGLERDRAFLSLHRTGSLGTD